MLCSVWAVRRVALLAEGVDRNIVVTLRAAVLPVALLAEGVDRNWPTALLRSFTDVALLAEGVDRNCLVQTHPMTPPMSPSSRRAWIEIAHSRPGVRLLRKSPSSRRAWIEIVLARCSNTRGSRRPPHGGRG